MRRLGKKYPQLGVWSREKDKSVSHGGCGNGAGKAITIIQSRGYASKACVAAIK